MIPRSKASFQNETTTRRPEVVSIFAKMSKYIDWIEKNMKPCPIAYMYLHILNPNLPYITIHLPYQTFPTFLWTSLDWFLLNKGGTCISSATRCSSRRKARTSGRAVRVGRDQRHVQTLAFFSGGWEGWIMMEEWKNWFFGVAWTNYGKRNDIVYWPMFPHFENACLHQLCLQTSPNFLTQPNRTEDLPNLYGSL